MTTAALQARQPSTELKLWEDAAPPHTVEAPEAERIDRHGHIFGVSEPTMTIFPAAPALNTGAAVLLFPGGGYGFVSSQKEGTHFARWFAEQGVTAVVLKYRMPYGHHEIPAEDAVRAFELFRKCAPRYGVDPKRIGVMGFSAGGHLAATMLVHGTGAARPDFGILAYPVITFDEALTHQGSVLFLLGEQPDPALRNHYSLERHVTEQTPPTLILASCDDTTVRVENSLLFFDALRAHDVPTSLHLFPSGGHGWGFVSDFRYHEIMKELVMDWIEQSAR